ncbi:hypothetical protein [Acetobacter sp.]|jgi:hypothetical protein|uniref:hypothetical protein n=1 Tax=Acetobacter sp. TaxID=440 RepID=UPI0025C5111B|nr:hypothetical protein [Acetobacter sp.]MCH4092019.1 hypothetical protein [Acetobacter sp.]MCI1300726.1 hypothetical protein [Acetobacter sp.]MCI1317521.1 hypothetical protein [Acetobacter sp.]
MSFSNKDRKIHAKDGNNFPVDPSADTEATFAVIIADALRRDFGSTPAHVKHIARLTGANMRTVGNWLSAKNGPNGSSLVVLMRHSDEVTMAVLKLSEREDLQRAVSERKILKELRCVLIAALKYLPLD